MSDFKDLLISETGAGKGRWKTSQLGNWLYVMDGFEADNGEVYASKSKKGNPFQIKIHQDALERFIQHLTDVKNLLFAESRGGWAAKDDDVPF